LAPGRAGGTQPAVRRQHVASALLDAAESVMAAGTGRALTAPRCLDHPETVTGCGANLVITDTGNNRIQYIASAAGTNRVPDRPRVALEWHDLSAGPLNFTPF
jgi:hypothetical protein